MPTRLIQTVWGSSKPTFYLILLASLLLSGCETTVPTIPSFPTDTEEPQIPYNPYWDTNFPAPEYLIHATGHGTMDGPREDDWWFLYPAAPNGEGHLELPDGSGGTFGYTTDHGSGPYMTPREVCSAAGGNFGDRPINIHPYGDAFRCKEVLASRPGQNPPGQGPGSQVTEEPSLTPTPTDTPEAQKPFTAWLDCGGSIKLQGPTDDFGAYCDVCVSGWQSRQNDRVLITFQTQTDSWGALPNGLVAFPGSTSDDSTNMHSTGVNDYYDQKCYTEHFKSNNTPPGLYTIPILVSQNNVGQQQLNLSIEVPDSLYLEECTDGQISNFSLVTYQDVVSGSTWAADGMWDALFQLDLASTSPQTTVTHIRLETADANGWPDGTNRVWTTDPGGWFLGAYLGNSQALNNDQMGINVNIGQNLTLYLSANVNDAFIANQTFLVTVYLQDRTLCYRQATVTLASQ